MEWDRALPATPLTALLVYAPALHQSAGWALPSHHPSETGSLLRRSRHAGPRLADTRRPLSESPAGQIHARPFLNLVGQPLDVIRPRQRINRLRRPRLISDDLLRAQRDPRRLLGR